MGLLSDLYDGNADQYRSDSSWFNPRSAICFFNLSGNRDEVFCGEIAISIMNQALGRQNIWLRPFSIIIGY